MHIILEHSITVKIYNSLKNKTHRPDWKTDRTHLTEEENTRPDIAFKLTELINIKCSRIPHKIYQFVCRLVLTFCRCDFHAVTDDSQIFLTKYINLSVD